MFPTLWLEGTHKKNSAAAMKKYSMFSNGIAKRDQ